MRKPSPILILLACGLLIHSASCTTTRVDSEGSIPLPAHFSETGAEALPEKWWESLSDPTLNLLVEQALRDNLDLRMVWDRLDQAEAVLVKAGAGRLPSLNATAGASRTSEHTQTVTPEGESDTTTDDRTRFSLGLAASYELDLWGRVRSTRDAAALDAEATREELRAAAITLSARVASAWYQLVEQYARVDLLQEQVKTNEAVLDLVTTSFRQGQVGATDVLQQEQLTESRRGSLAATQGRAEVLEHQLAILLGQPPSRRVAPRTTELMELPPLPETGAPADLVQRRPDIRRAYARVQAADERVAAAISDRFPRINLTAQWNTSGEETRDLFDNWLATLAADVIAPLFDAGSRRAEVRRSRAVMSERFHAYGQTILTALGEVEDALSLERHQRVQLASVEKQLDLSGKAMERLRDQYVYGATDYLQVLNALNAHQVLQVTALDTRRSLIESRIGLHRALGSGWKVERATEQPVPAPTEATLPDDVPETKGPEHE